MPQPVTLSIAMGAPNPKVDDDDGTKNIARSPSKKNNESLSQPQPPQSQGREDVSSSAARPASIISSSSSSSCRPAIKTPRSIGGKLETKTKGATLLFASVTNPVVPVAVIRRNDTAVEAKVAKAAPIKRTRKKAKLKNNARKIKTATQKSKVPSSNDDDDDEARLANMKQQPLPTPPTSCDGKPSSSTNNNNDMGEKKAVGTNTSNTTSASPRLHDNEFVFVPLRRNDTVHPPTINNNSKSSSSVVVVVVGEEEEEEGPPKKRTKKLTSKSKEKVNRNHNNSSSSSSSSNNLRGTKFKARVYSAPSIADNSHLRKVVCAVIDVVSDEMRYCASVLFGSSSSSSSSSSSDERANGDDEGIVLPHRKIASSSSSPAGVTMPVGSSKKTGLDDPSSASLSRKGKGKLRSVNISAEDTIHPTKKNYGTTTTTRSSSELRNRGSTPSENRTPKSERHLREREGPSSPPPADSQRTATRDDVRRIVIAVRKFALEVYLPHLLSAKKSATAGDDDDGREGCAPAPSPPDADRIRISTLLAVREMLILNAEKMFAFHPSSSFDFDRRRRHQSSSSSSSSSSSYGGNGRERIHLSHVFANAIVGNAVKRFRMRQPQVVADFARALRNYDDCSEDFRFSLVPADVQSTTFAYNNNHRRHRHPKGGQQQQQQQQQGGGGGEMVLDREESVLAGVSFNYARERHPLMMCRNNTITAAMPASGYDDGDIQVGMAKNENNNNWPVHPMPTACAAFHIEPSGVSVTTEDDTDVLESFKTLLRSKRVAL